ncbi:MAG: hypothetical protein F4213_05690 [Boseongicola sp. SB0677_bin_26]|nr:hypothetical protein [Boseongicola sp. SB0665_bin_10]MYG25499.1 hypothetical protein [Boseongicola sp. SB0677_bin_26]
MAWNGIMCTMLAHEEPPRPDNGDFPPDGWAVGHLIPVPGQDDGKKLWGCAVVAVTHSDGEEVDAHMEWTGVRELEPLTHEAIN